MPTQLKPGDTRASSTERVIECNGSVILNQGVASDSSEFAKEGTAAHSLLEFCFRFETDPIEMVGEEIEVQEDDGTTFMYTVTPEMADAVSMMVGFTKALEGDHPGATVHYERGLNGAALEKDGFDLSSTTGHIDYCLTTETHVHIVDFKYGIGIHVDAEANRQLLTYAMLAIADMKDSSKIESISISIVQPRGLKGEKIRTFEVTPEQLQNFVNELFTAIVTISSLDEATFEDHLVIGDHCAFCPGQAKCPAFHKEARKVALTEFDPGLIANLTPEAMAFWLDNEKLFRDWLEAIKLLADKTAKAGGKIPGRKLVQTIANRKYIDDAETTEKKLRKFGFLKKDLFSKPKLVSVPQIEKLGLEARGKSAEETTEFLASLVHRPPSGIKLVALSDSREEIKLINAEDEFDVITDEDPLGIEA